MLLGSYGFFPRDLGRSLYYVKEARVHRPPLGASFVCAALQQKKPKFHKS